MAKSMKKMLLLAAVQTAVGTPAVPTAAANAIMCRAQNPEPIAGDQVPRQLIRPFKGNSGKLFAGEHRKLTFEVELAGSGAAGKAPAWGPVLRACGFSETITVGQDVVYLPVSEGEPVLTLWGYIDGTKYVIEDAKGNVSFELNSKGIPVMKFEFIGTYSPLTEGAMPTGVDYSAFMQPKTVGKKNTPTFTFYGLAACTSAFSIAMGNQLAWKERINCAGASSPDRQPTGSVTLEMPKATTKDWGEVVREGTLGEAILVHGTTPGNIVELQLPQIQCGPFSIQDDGGDAMLTLPFDLMPDQGDDELTIIVR